MEKVNQETLDVGAVVVLIGHDHDMTVAEALGGLVRGAVAEAEDLLDVVNLGVVHDLIVACVTNVEKLTAEREDAVSIATDDGETGHRECLRRVTLGEDEGAVLGVAAARVVGVIELGNAGEPGSLLAVRLFHLLALLEGRPGEDLLDDTAAHHLLDDLVAGLVLAAEVGRAGVERFLGLRVKRGVLNESVDKHPEVVLDVSSLEVLARLLLLLDLLEELTRHLIGDLIDVRAALHGANAVDEGHLLEVARVRDGHANLPAVVNLLVNLGGVLPALQVKVDVIAEALHLEPLAVEEHLGVLADVTGGVINALAHQSHGVVLELGHVKLGEVGLEGDAGPVVGGLALGHYRFALLTHVVLEHLAVPPLAAAVAGLDDKLGGEDVGQLGAVSIPAAGNLLLVVVVVGRREQVTKDELGDVDSLLLVHLDRDAVAVVVHADAPGFLVDVDAEGHHRGIAHLIVGGVDEDLVEDLVETGDEGHLALDQFVGVLAVHPGLLLSLLARADVGIGAEEDVLELGLLLVDILDGLAVGGGGRRGLGRVDILLAEGSLGLLRRGGLLGLGRERGEGISMSDPVATQLWFSVRGRTVRGARARTLGAAATFSLIATISATSAMMRSDGYRRADGRVAGSRRGFDERAR